MTAGKLLLKVRLACSLPALNVEELAAMVEAWCEVLAPVVPANRLNDCYLHAMRNRSSTFPLASTELLTSWRIINAEESHERQFNKPCRLCFGQGFGKVYDPTTDTEVLKECPHCFGKITNSLTVQ